MLSLKELRPGSLYATTLEDRVAEFIDRRFPSQGRYPLRISTALFSWGDAAHEALPSTW
jgi:hypothetical protein